MLNINPKLKLYENISYGASKDNLLDIYKPCNKEVKEIIIYIPGGGWILDNRQDSPTNVQRNFCIELAQTGFLVISASLGTAPENNYESQLENLMKVIFWTKANYGSLSSIVLCGYSSGGHLAALASEHLNNQNKALIGICGVYDILYFGKHFIERIGTVQPAFSQDKNVWKKASPVVYAEKLKLPVFLLESENRLASMKHQNEKFAASLKNVKLQTIFNTNHFTILLQKELIAESIKLFLENL